MYAMPPEVLALPPAGHNLTCKFRQLANGASAEPVSEIGGKNELQEVTACFGGAVRPWSEMIIHQAAKAQ